MFGKTTTWAYDNNGNILVKKEYDLTAKPTQELRLLSPLACKLYTYQNNSDQLTSYGNDTFHYDGIGNPDIYRSTTARWDKGRQLIELGNHSFSYDARGRRTNKDNITFTYDSDGNLIRQSDDVEALVFLYDHTGVFAVKYDNATYYYRKDAQGNVIALLDNTGAIVVKYVYDAWGNCKALNANGVEITDTAHIGYLNPFRYRGYYYDVETKLYFLQTRYYDPEIGRFITIDDISYLDPDSINGLNLYAYCGNNPVMSVDPNGNAWWNWVLSGVALVAGIALCFVPGAQGAGASLIVAGATSMASNIMSAAGVDGKTASIISNVLSIIGGVALCYTPFASIGASMIGSGALGLIGGAISESIGFSFETGSAIGNILGGFLGGAIYKGLLRTGKVSFQVKLQDLQYSPSDEFITQGPREKAITYWTKKLAMNPKGYNIIPNCDGKVEAICIVYNSNNVLSNGHHRVYVMKNIINNAPKYIKVFYAK